MLNKRVGSLLLPAIGLSTYDLAENDMKDVITEGVNQGVNFIDSANRYENEEQIGRAIKELGLPRHDIFMGTKMSYKQQMTQQVCQSVDESLRKLCMEYVDIYMIHSPKSKTYCDDWISLQAEKKKGKIRELAVSNFSSKQIEEIFIASGEYPVLNQVEVNLLNIPWDTFEYCEHHDIKVQASCPLYRMQLDFGKGSAVHDVMAKYHKTYPQIVLRWLFQRGLMSVPKTSSVTHLVENIDIFGFEISEEDLQKLESMSKSSIS